MYCDCGYGMVTVFLTHSKKDMQIVRQVYVDLRAKGLHVWFDESDLSPGDYSWRRTIAAAIREADCVVALFSPNALLSTWVQKELDYAEGHEKRIIPVMIAGTERDSLPFGYIGAQFIDLRTPERYSSGLQQLVKAAYGISHWHESPTLHKPLNLSLPLPLPPPRERVAPQPLSVTRPSKTTQDMRRITIPTKRSKWRRWWEWILRQPADTAR